MSGLELRELESGLRLRECAGCRSLRDEACERASALHVPAEMEAVRCFLRLARERLGRGGGSGESAAVAVVEAVAVVATAGWSVAGVAVEEAAVVVASARGEDDRLGLRERLRERSCLSSQAERRAAKPADIVGISSSSHESGGSRAGGGAAEQSAPS